MYLKSKNRYEARYSEGLLGKISWFFWNTFWNQEKEIKELKKVNMTDYVVTLVKDYLCIPLPSRFNERLINSGSLEDWLASPVNIPGSQIEPYEDNPDLRDPDETYTWNRLVVFHRVLKRMETLDDNKLQRDIEAELNPGEQES